MADFVTPCNGHKTDLFYRKIFSIRCEKVLHRYNQLKALVLLNNTVTLGCYKGVTSVTESQREKDFRYV